MTAFRPTVAEVDLEAIRHNVRTLTPPGAELMAVVKADAYGHGAVPVARAALEAGAAWLGVALVEEGIELRSAGIEAPVLLLSEPPPGSEGVALEARLTPTVYSFRGAEALEEAAAARGGSGQAVGVHVKVDTGMHRVGVWPPEGAVALVRHLRSGGLSVEGVWTHLARSEDDDALTGDQVTRFLEVVDALAAEGVRPRYRHVANSGGTLLYPAGHLDLVRVGVALYGLDPGPGLAEQAGLRPALSWRTEVAFVKRLPPGEGISYGHRYTTERETTIATLPVGYADGYSRRMTGRAQVLIEGRRHPVAGTITMDQILVDCGDTDVGEGAEAVLLGRQGEQRITAGELAVWGDTIDYEVVCGIAKRVPRRYVG